MSAETPVDAGRRGWTVDASWTPRVVAGDHGQASRDHERTGYRERPSGMDRPEQADGRPVGHQAGQEVSRVDALVGLLDRASGHPNGPREWTGEHTKWTPG